MLTLASSNAAKYAPFREELERMRVVVEPPPEALPEIQTLDFQESLAAKAKAAAALFRHPVLVDDAGVVIEEWRPFPGPLTTLALRGLGLAGLRRLAGGGSQRATMECHLGWWDEGRLRSWSGTSSGVLDTTREPADRKMMLSTLFVPDEPGAGPLTHRRAALHRLAGEVFELHLASGHASPDAAAACPAAPPPPCPFCVELQHGPQSIFADMMGEWLPSRVVYEDEDFIVMPPLGQFIPGGLLLLSRQHIRCFAELPAELHDRLDALLRKVTESVAARWGVPPLVFEHGPSPDRGKGVCCVDHAHLNLFPAPVVLHPHLAGRMSLRVGSLGELGRLRTAEFGYLFIQENDGTRRAYDAHQVPSQLVRRIITKALGMPERWHWRDYPGRDELLATHAALKGAL